MRNSVNIYLLTLLETSKFIQRYSQSYPPQKTYYLLNHDLLHTTCNHNFCTSRTDLLIAHSEGKKTHFEFTQAILSEFVTVLALEKPLFSHNYSIELATQSLEHGQDHQRGVDILITNSQKKIMLGIDIKLGKSSSRFNSNGGHWLDHLKAPFINLTLGNWRPDIKDWLKNAVRPNIEKSGSIPDMPQFRSFLIPRIKNSLLSQHSLLINRSPRLLIPETRKDCQVYRQKLEGLIDLFTQMESL